MNRKETIKLLSVLMANYPNAKIKDAAKTADTWEMTLGCFEAEAVYKAARLHMTNSKFFPTPADVLEKMTRAAMIYSAAPGYPQMLRPCNSSTKVPDGMTENEYLNAIIRNQIELECEIEGTKPPEDLTKYFLPFET